MTEAITQDSAAHESTSGQGPREKKRRLIKRIFKCLGLGLLVLLIIAALIFQAPWKIITLLLIILAACTILPKPARKWFWLSVAAIVVVLIIWIFLPEDDEGWRPYTFDEELAALQARYAIPDEENAALMYDRLFETIDGDPNEPEFFARSSPSSRDEPWLSKDHPETAEWLKGYEQTISTLIEISGLEKCSFPVAAELTSLSQHMKQLASMRRCTLLLLAAGNNDVAEGRSDAALEKYLCIARMAHHVYQQQPMIDYLIGLSIEYLPLTQLNRFVIESQPNKEQLELIGNCMKGPQNNWRIDWPKMLDFENLLSRNSICSLLYEANPRGRVRLSGGPLTIERQVTEKIPPKNYLQKRLTRVSRILGRFYFPSSPKSVAQIIDAGFEKYYVMAEPNFDWGNQPGESRRRWKGNYRFWVELFADISEQVFYRVHEIYLRNLSLRRGSRLLVAIKQYQMEHNAWPADLDAIRTAVPAEALIDPVTEKEFTYMNHGQRFSLYGETANIWPR